MLDHVQPAAAPRSAHRLPGAGQARSLVRALAVPVRRRLRPSRPHPVGTMLAAFADATAARPVTFVQVGSNDGVTEDPLRALAEEHQWSGVLVEPVPYVFERLRAARGGNPRLALVNAAVADHDGEAEFFHLRQGDAGDPLPEWYDQLGSFSLETLLSHEAEVPGLRQRLVSARVPCLTFDSLCREHGIAELDLIHIDTEGYDWEIVRRIDFTRYAPKVLLFEHWHLRPTDRQACREFLAARDFACHEGVQDTICVQRRTLADDRLRRAWATFA